MSPTWSSTCQPTMKGRVCRVCCVRESSKEATRNLRKIRAVPAKILSNKHNVHLAGRGFATVLTVIDLSSTSSTTRLQQLATEPRAMKKLGDLTLRDVI